MGWTLSYHLFPLIGTGAVSLTLMLIVWRSRTKAGAVSLLVVLFGVLGWTAMSIVQIASNDVALVGLVDLLKMLFIPLTAVGFFILAATYTNSNQFLTTRALAAATSVPVLTGGVVLTQAFGLHSFFYSAIETRTVTTLRRTIVLPNSGVGPWFLVHSVHSYTLVFIGALLLLRSAINSWSVYRGQAIVMLVAVTAPISMNVLRLSGVTEVDYTPFGFGITAIAVAWGLFRYELLDLVPVARDTVIEEMRDAVIVLDPEGRIADANDAARPIIGNPDDTIGMDAANVLPFDTAPHLVDPDGGWQELTLEHDGQTAHYRLESTPVCDRRGKQTGTLLVLQDITEIKRREQQLRETGEELEILNRVVRHDIQNDMNVVAGHAQLLEERIDDEELTTHIEPIRQNTEHTIELTETVRGLLESITGGANLDLKTIELCWIVEEEVDKARQTYDEATVSLSAPDEQVFVFANSMLSSVFKNLFSNAIRHNDTENPEITATVTVENGHVRVTVADDGPGVPDDQKETVFGRNQKGLDSPGTGVGLYLVDTLVTRYGGRVWIEDNEPRGAAFVVELPTTDRQTPH